MAQRRAQEFGFPGRQGLINNRTKQPRFGGQVSHTFFARVSAALTVLTLSHLREVAHKDGLQRIVANSQVLTFLFFLL